MEEERGHEKVHTLLRDAVTQQLGADPALGQPAGAAKDGVLLLEPTRRQANTCECSTDTSQDPKHPSCIQQKRRINTCWKHVSSTTSTEHSVGAEILEGTEWKCCYTFPSNHTALWCLSPRVHDL